MLGMIKRVIICVSLAASIIADQLTVRLLPEEDLADLIHGQPSVIISGSNLDGRCLFTLISNHISSLLPNKSLIFECNDFKFMSGYDLADICHNHLFVNKGTLDIIAHGSKLAKKAFHVNLYLPKYIPVDEHVLLPPCKATFDTIQLSTLSASHTLLARLMKKTFVLSEEHPMMSLSDNTDIFEIEEKTWHLDFAAFSMLYDLKDSMKEFMNLDPLAYGKLFDKPIQLLRTIHPRTYLFYRGECKKHIARHLCEKVSSKSKESDQKNTRILALRRELDTTLMERNEFGRQILILKRVKNQLENNLQQAENEKEGLSQTFADIQADRDQNVKDLANALNKLAKSSEKIANLEKKLAETNEGIEVFKHKLANSEKLIEGQHEVIMSQRGLIKKLHTSCELGVSFTNLLDMPSSPEELLNMIKWTHAAARYETLGDISEYTETNLGPEEKAAMRRLWLETYYSEGVRLGNWLKLAKTEGWRDVFLFEACYTTFNDDQDEEKIKRKLAKMKNDIIRLESRVMEVIDELQTKCKDATEHDDITAFKVAAEQSANSALDVDIYVKAFNVLQQ